MSTTEIITLIGIIVAVIAALASWTSVLINYIIIKRKRKEEFEDHWHRCREYRGIFWEALDEAYYSFVADKNEVPTKLADLIESVLMPPNLPVPKGRLLDDWINDNHAKLRQYEKTMLEFVCQVYPEKKDRTGNKMDYSIISEDYSKGFHKARKESTIFFEIWPERIGIKTVKTNQHFKAKDLIMLCWLDIALRQWSKDKDRGKEWMYKLGGN